MPQPTIGCIGLGYMGVGMASNLLRKGYAVTVLGHRNRAPVDRLLAEGAQEAKDLPALIAACDILQLCLPHSGTVEALVRGPGGLLQAGRTGQIVIDATTADPGSTVALAADLAGKGITLVDAPLGRTPKEAEAGTLDAMVGCDDATWARVGPVIECWAANITRTGPVGSAHKMKLVMNFLSLGYAALYSEALVMAVKSGLSPQTMHQVIGTSRLSNGFYETFMRAAVGRERDAHKFSIANAAKDVRYAAQMAMGAGMANPMGAAIRNAFAQAEAAGRADWYVPWLADHIAEQNGLDLAEAVRDGAPG